MTTSTRARRNGEGSVDFFRPRNRWRAQWHPLTGPRKAKLFRTEREALDHLVKVRADALAGIATPTSRHTLGSWLPVWLAMTERKPGTQSRYQYAVNHWLRDPIAKTQLTKLLRDDVALALGRMRAGGMSASSRRYVLDVLRNALSGAVRSRHVVINVAADVPTPKVERAEISVPRGLEYARLLAAISDDRHEALWMVGLSNGLRSGEARGLRWGDVDLPRRELTVRRTVDWNGGNADRPKSPAARRTIRIAPDVAAALYRWQTRSLGPGVTPHPAAYVFAYRTGTPFAGADVLSWWHAVCDAAGVKHYRYHDLRHACATRLVEHGWPIGRLAQFLGHSSWRQTERYYRGADLAALEPPELNAVVPAQAR